jgi:diadenosine tetraphosphate (Ap4A) HIT family hydrolase
MEKEDIFCTIAKGNAPAFRIYEDKAFVAILDIYPNIMGQTLVISKKHHTGYAFDLNDRELREFIVATKRVSKLLERKLRVKRVHVVFEGTGINHLHAKLYPAIGLKQKYAEVWAKDKKYFKKYEGYVTTLTGPKASEKELRRVYNKIVE